MIDITKEEWLAWKADRTTRWLFEKINENLNQLKDEIISDRFPSEELQKMIGIGMGLRVVLESKPDFTEESV